MAEREPLLGSHAGDDHHVPLEHEAADSITAEQADRPAGSRPPGSAACSCAASGHQHHHCCCDLVRGGSTACVHRRKAERPSRDDATSSSLVTEDNQLGPVTTPSPGSAGGVGATALRIDSEADGFSQAWSIDDDEDVRDNCKPAVRAIVGARDFLHWLLTPKNPVLLPAHHSPLFPALVKRKRRMPYVVRMFVISVYLAVCVALLLVLFFFNTYAAITDYGRPARMDCWDKVDMINRTKFTIFGDPEWIPFRCPAYCRYRGDGVATPVGNATLSTFTQDSALCVAALQKDLVTTMFGGCAIVRLHVPTPPTPPPAFVAPNTAMSATLRLSGPADPEAAALGSLRYSTSAVGERHGAGAAAEATLGAGGGDASAASLIGRRLIRLGSAVGESDPSQQDAAVDAAGDHQGDDGTLVAADRGMAQLDGGGGTDGENARDSHAVPWDALPANFTIELAQCESKHCYELSFTVLWAGLAMLVLLLLLSPPKGVFYSALMVVGYWYVVFVVYPTYNEKGRDRVDDALGTFSTYLVFIYALYRFSVHITIFNTSRGVYVPDTILLFVCPFFVMLHMSYVKPFFDWSITKGGFANLNLGQVIFAATLLSIIGSISLMQFTHIYRHGLLSYYLGGYLIVALVCLTITLLTKYANGLSFHLHHYQLSLLLLPLVRFQTRFCVLCTGLLLGMFVNGVACYGFDSTWVLFEPAPTPHTYPH